jgi:hypothetical protein
MLIDDGFVQIPTIAAASVASPVSGSVKLFFDSSNANRLSQKDSAGAVIDLASATGGSSALTSGTVLLNFGTAGSDQATVTVTTSAVTNNSIIFCRLNPLGTADNNSDEILVEGVTPKAVNQVSGTSFDITMLQNESPLYGNWAVDWVILFVGTPT